MSTAAASPTVSVVMAVRNGGSLLGEAIASVRAQTHPAAEIIVVDGASVDDTVPVALAAGARVVQQRGATLADAYNTGIEEAAGTHVAFLSHDDLWMPGKTAAQLAVLAANPDAAAAIGQAAFVLLDADAAPRGMRRELLDAPRVAPIMETLLAPRDTFRRVGPLDPAMSPADDTDWFARLADLGLRLVAADEVVVTKRLTPDSTAHGPANTRDLLLRVVRASVARKRANAQAPEPHTQPAHVRADAEIDRAGGTGHP